MSCWLFSMPCFSTSTRSAVRPFVAFAACCADAEMSTVYASLAVLSVVVPSGAVVFVELVFV